MAVTLTENAANEVRNFFEKAKFSLDDGYFLRVGIAAGGCSGFQYDLKPDQEFDEAKDSRYDMHGVPVVVDKKSALYLDGVTIDYYQRLERSGFTFDNPNVVKSCGCGSSFQA